MKITCPECSTEKHLTVQAKVVCDKCQCNLSEYEYKSAPLLSTTMALLLGAGGFFAVDQTLLEGNRYPLSTEYAIIDTCANAHGKFQSRSKYKQQRDICICALKKTEEDLSYSDYKDDRRQFNRQFRQNVSRCR